MDDFTLTQEEWTLPEGETPASSSLVTEQVVRSQAGRIIQDTVLDGGVSEDYTYRYDGAGRLVAASLPSQDLKYEFGTTSCGNTNAGKNGNRTRLYTTPAQGGTPTTVASCYDTADRLTATTVTGAPTGASPVAGTNLTMTAPGATLAYDAHGNTTRLGDQTLVYDVTNRHMGRVRWGFVSDEQH